MCLSNRGSSAFRVCLLDNLFDHGAELEHPAPKRDAADREPGPAEGQPGDDIAQPVKVEQHACAGDGDRYRGGGARDETASS